MTSLLSSSLLALAAVSSVYSTPLSTSSYYAPSHRSVAPAPIVEAFHPHGTVNDSYIVVLKEDFPVSLMENHINFLQAAHHGDPLDHEDAGLRHVYGSVFKGYAGRFTNGVIDQIRSLPEVDFVERDQIVRTQEITVQRGAPWGLARISHRPKLGFGTFTKYEFEENGGEGVDVYVIDTGINIEHEEFEGRAIWGLTVPQNDVDEDGNGHGTHCAGTIASRKYGVAKKATVIAVKVLGTNGSGSMQDVIAGVDFASTQAAKKKAAADAQFQATGKADHKGSVANMSLGGGKSQALDVAVNRAVDKGLHFAVAAGNDNQDACKYSPAAAGKAVTVGASTMGDEHAYFSNHGECVDVFAPGLNILSTYKGGRTASATLSGTSMASPHVAGLLAYYLSLYPSATFDPKLGTFIPAPIRAQRPFTNSPVYSIVHSALPSFISSFLPSPKLFENLAPVPPKRPTITPPQLKEALIALSSKGLLKQLPPNTVNKLVFNNATVA